MSTEEEKTEWATRMNQLYVEGAGLWNLYVFFAMDVPGLLHGAENGDYASARMLRALGDFVLRAKDVPSDDPLLCFCCGAKMPALIGLPRAFAIVVPVNDAATVCCGGAVCRRCARGSREAVLQRALTGWRETIDPSARALRDVHPETRHA